MGALRERILSDLAVQHLLEKSEAPPSYFPSLDPCPECGTKYVQVSVNGKLLHACAGCGRVRAFEWRCRNHEEQISVWLRRGRESWRCASCGGFAVLTEEVLDVLILGLEATNGV